MFGKSVRSSTAESSFFYLMMAATSFRRRQHPSSPAPSALAEFQATTRGTASRAIKRLTSKGNKALSRDLSELLVRANDSLGAKERTCTQHSAPSAN
jgi:hypothetical protein